MYLRDLSIYANELVRMPKGHEQAEFNFSLHAVQEVFLSFLPRNSCILDGVAKLNIELGKGSWSKYTNLSDVSIYPVPDFDFAAYFRASRAERDEIILRVIEMAVLDIARMAKVDSLPLQNAIAATRACGCERKVEVVRLSRSTPSHRFRLNVFRHIKHDGEGWGIDVTDRSKRCVHTAWIAERTDWFRSMYSYRRSSISGDRFVIYDHVQKPVFKLNIAVLEKKLLRAE